MTYRFEWDARKARVNLTKHAVSFEEVSTVFRNPLAQVWFDEIHSDQEDRNLIVGHSNRGRLLFVSYTIRDPGTIRIISARLATGKERRAYEEATGFGPRPG